MKIGVLFAPYNCAADINRLVEPFLGEEFVISACNIQFDVFDTPPDEDTFKALSSHPAISFIATSPIPLREDAARNMALSYLLEKDVDFIWILDGDEFYTKEQVQGIVKEIRGKHLYEAFYSINFKNYIFDGKSWIDGFCPPRIFSNKIYGGIDSFYWDNDLSYKNGKPHSRLLNVIIPKPVAHVKHMTWLHSNGKSKVEYQMKHFNGVCSYIWNEDKKVLEFNPNFYKSRGIKEPEVFND